MKNIKQTKTISELLNTFTFGENSKGKSFSETIKHSTIFSFWEDIIGKKLAKFSKPIKIKYSKLYVTAKSPTITQELNLIKNKIITKANTYANALGFEIKDIVFDYKNYKNSEKTFESDEEKIEFYNNDNIDQINLDDGFKKEIKNNISKINFLSDKQKDLLIKKIFNTQKAKNKRTNS